MAKRDQAHKIARETGALVDWQRPTLGPKVAHSRLKSPKIALSRLKWPLVSLSH